MRRRYAPLVRRSDRDAGGKFWRCYRSYGGPFRELRGSLEARSGASALNKLRRLFPGALAYQVQLVFSRKVTP